MVVYVLRRIVLLSVFVVAKEGRSKEEGLVCSAMLCYALLCWPLRPCPNSHPLFLPRLTLKEVVNIRVLGIIPPFDTVPSSL